MRSCRPSSPGQHSHVGLDTGIFFLLFYVHVWLIVDPRLVDHAVGIVSSYSSLSFTTGWPFFREHLLRPGGIVEYVTRFSTPFFCWGWLGALIVTAVAWGTCFSIDALTRLAGLSRGIAVRLGPPLLLLMLYAGYSQPLRVGLSLLVVLAGFGFYTRAAPRNRTTLSVVVPAMCFALYYIAGSASVLFPVLVAVYELLVRRQWFAGLAGLFWGLAVPAILGTAWLGFPLRNAYAEFLAPVSGVTVADWPYVLALHLYFPVVLTGAALWKAMIARHEGNARNAASRTPSPSLSARFQRFLLAEESSRRMKTAAVFLGVAGIVWFNHVPYAKVVLKTDYCCRHGKWSQALEAAAKMPSRQYSSRFNRNVVLALYHTGRLGEEMFCYPQTNNTDLYTVSEVEDDVLPSLQVARFFMEIGEINRAERYACEVLTGTGDLPVVLEQLATINMVKNRPQTARVFLNALSKKPLHCRTAQERLRELGDDLRMDDDPTVSRLRKVMLTRDSVSYVTGVEATLMRLLARNRRNKMAFDFLLVHYLITGQPNQVVANLQYLEDFGYRRIPRHFQEAVVAHASATGDWSLTDEYGVAPEILGQQVLLTQILASAPSEDEAVKAAIAAGLGDSYLFYLRFGRSGL